MKIAVLLTTYKRKNETEQCLKALARLNFKLDIFISDSNSRNEIEKLLLSYKNIYFDNVGDDIFWNRGMNISWAKAFTKDDYDFYLWLNNDTYLYEDSLKTLFGDYKKISFNSILVGITEYENELTYGGRNGFNETIIKPNGIPQKIKIINGNCVLVPKSVFKNLGYFDNKFSHSLGDIDYGLRAIKNGIHLYCTSKIIGRCKKNDSKWYDSKSFLKRYKNLISPKGVPPFEYFYFNKKHFGILHGVKFLIATLVALFSPKIYQTIKQK